MRARDGLGDAARAGLEDAPVEVDDEVVADVVPAVRVDVEGVDRPQHRRHLAGAVAVGVLGVVHERHPHRAIFRGDARRRDPERPGAAGDDRRLPGARGERAARPARATPLRRRVRARARAGADVDDVEPAPASGCVGSTWTALAPPVQIGSPTLSPPGSRRLPGRVPASRPRPTGSTSPPPRGSAGGCARRARPPRRARAGRRRSGSSIVGPAGGDGAEVRVLSRVCGAAPGRRRPAARARVSPAATDARAAREKRSARQMGIHRHLSTANPGASRRRLP